MQITIEYLITRIVQEVIKELKDKNISVTFSNSAENKTSSHSAKTETIDMSKYKTPVLTENHIQRLHALTGEIIIPEGTIITPKAKELIQEKQLQITIQ